MDHMKIVIIFFLKIILLIGDANELIRYDLD